MDEALVNMIMKDCQPFTVVEDEGFRNLIHFLHPSYTLPTRYVFHIYEWCWYHHYKNLTVVIHKLSYICLLFQPLKTMVLEKYNAANKTAKEEVQKAAAVSLAADKWTSMIM